MPDEDMSDGCGNASITNQRHCRRMAWSDVKMQQRRREHFCACELDTHRMGSIILGEEDSIVTSIASTERKAITNLKC